MVFFIVGKKYNTVGETGFGTHEADPAQTVKKSRIEVNIDFKAMKKQPSKRTILSKNRGSAKSFNSLVLQENSKLNSKDVFMLILI